jgi:hypothetical protein
MNSPLCWRGATDAYLPSKASFSFQSPGFGPSQIRISAPKNSGSLNGSPWALPLIGDHRAGAWNPFDEEVLAGQQLLVVAEDLAHANQARNQLGHFRCWGLLSSTPRVNSLPSSAESNITQHRDGSCA